MEYIRESMYSLLLVGHTNGMSFWHTTVSVYNILW